MNIINIKTILKLLLNMSIVDLSWEEILKESFKCYLINGASSTKKLIYPHYWIREKLKSYFDDSYEFYSYGINNSHYDKEISVKGFAYEKKPDITIIKDGDVVGVISFKFVSSNYSQNSNNYFENLLGECFNIQAKGIPFCHILVMRDKIPYFYSNGDYKNCEKLKNHHLDKYFKLLNIDKSYESIPEKLCINIIEISVENNNLKVLSPKKFKNYEKCVQNDLLDGMSVNIVHSYENCSKNINVELKKMDILNTLKEFSEIVKKQ